MGDLIEVHFYDGNRGPLFHLADKVEVAQRRSSTPEARLVVVPEGGRRRQPPRLPRLRRHARHLVLRRRGPDRGDLHRRRDARHRGRRAFDHGLPLRPRPVEVRDAVGTLTNRGSSSRSRSAASCSSAPTARFRATTTTTTSRSRPSQPAHVRVPVDVLPAGRRNPVEYMPRPARRRRADRRAARPRALPHRPARGGFGDALGADQADRAPDGMTSRTAGRRAPISTAGAIW